MCRLSWNMGASTSWKPLDLSRSVKGLLYLYLLLYCKSQFVCCILIPIPYSWTQFLYLTVEHSFYTLQLNTVPIPYSWTQFLYLTVEHSSYTLQLNTVPIPYSWTQFLYLTVEHNSYTLQLNTIPVPYSWTQFLYLTVEHNFSQSLPVDFSSIIQYLLSKVLHYWFITRLSLPIYTVGKNITVYQSSSKVF